MSSELWGDLQSSLDSVSFVESAQIIYNFHLNLTQLLTRWNYLHSVTRHIQPAAIVKKAREIVWATTPSSNHNQVLQRFNQLLAGPLLSHPALPNHHHTRHYLKDTCTPAPKDMVSKEQTRRTLRVNRMNTVLPLIRHWREEVVRECRILK